MNWMLPAQQLGRRLQGPACANRNCSYSAWERWRSRHSGVLLDGRWYCSESCLKVALQLTVSQGSHSTRKGSDSAHRLPLGLLLFSRGIIDQQDLARALQMKADDPQARIGECLCQLGRITEEQVTRAVGMQNGLPVLIGYQPRLERLVPVRLQEAADACCFRTTRSPAILFVGFSVVVDPSLVRAIESILGTTVEPCVLPSCVVKERLRSLADIDSREVVFETPMRRTEMIDSICSYAKQLGAEFLRVARTRDYLWIRLQSGISHDLLFRLAEEN